MSNILIVDDNIDILQSYKRGLETNKDIQSIGKPINIYIAPTYNNALELSQKIIFDIFLLDVDLAYMYTGIDLANELRKNSHYKIANIIFATADPKKEMEAFRNIHCYSYLVKPFSEEELINAIFPLIKYGKVQQDYKLIITNNYTKIAISIDEIIYIEAVLRGTKIHTLYETITARYENLKNILSQLSKDPSCNFIQCHKSFIINKNYMKCIHKNENIVEMKNAKEQIPVGKKFRNELLEAFS